MLINVISYKMDDKVKKSISGSGIPVLLKILVC